MAELFPFRRLRLSQATRLPDSTAVADSEFKKPAEVLPSIPSQLVLYTTTLPPQRLGFDQL